MLPASRIYKESMKLTLRNRSYMKVTIGMVNQGAQASANILDYEAYTYYSNLSKPFNNYSIDELYATPEQDYAGVDGNMYFLPRSKGDVVLNAGIVSETLLGPVEIRFPIQYDLKGLTIEFGKAYPVDFVIESDNNSVEINGNNSGHFVTEELFSEATYLMFRPAKMINGLSRFRIHMITMGIGVYFDNKKILSGTKKEHISPISKELPAIDFDLTVENKDRVFDVENRDSSVNFLELGQDVIVQYGYEVDDGAVEWMQGARLQLKEWSADDEKMNFSATDRFDSMDGTYYRGKYYTEGISLYALADDVFKDAGVDIREYWIDPYLRDVKINNPMPPVSHKEALQIIANAGRCILSQNREGSLFMKSSFIPDMVSSSDDEAYFSHVARLLDCSKKEEYALVDKDYTDVVSTQFFLPRDGDEYLNTGYISKAVSQANGSFLENPTVKIGLEAAYKCFGLTLEFGRNPPNEMIFHAYYNNNLQEDYHVSDLTEITIISHEFPEFDYLILEFVKANPYNRVVLDSIYFGDSTDYVLEYGKELTKSPRGAQLAKVKQLEVIRTMYGQEIEEKELAKVTLSITTVYNQYTFYFSNASYNLSVIITDAETGQTAAIVESSSYYAVVEFTGVNGVIEASIRGAEYIITKSRISEQLNPSGAVEQWENPLVSDAEHARDLVRWIGDYLASDRNYELQYRGEPRLDANDIAFLENRYVSDMLVRVYDHTLKFNGALSGTIKARRDMSGMVTAKNKLGVK